MKYSLVSSLPFVIRNQIYHLLDDGDDLLNFHRSNPDLTPELASFEDLVSVHGYKASDLFPTLYLKPFKSEQELAALIEASKIALYVRVTDTKTLEIATSLLSKFPEIKIFRADGGLGDAGLLKMSQTILSGNHKVTEIYILRDSIGVEGAKAISKVLEGENSNLTSLYLCNNRIGDEGAKVIATALQSGQSKIKRLGLSNNNISDVGIRLIAEALSTGKTPLENLTLDLNEFGDEGFEAILQALESGNSQISEISISENYSITDQMVKYMTERFQQRNIILH